MSLACMTATFAATLFLNFVECFLAEIRILVCAEKILFATRYVKMTFYS